MKPVYQFFDSEDEEKHINVYKDSEIIVCFNINEQFNISKEESKKFYEALKQIYE